MFEGLNYKKLEKASGYNGVGCPFHIEYGGPISSILIPTQEDRTACNLLCGKLFHFERVDRCPCFIIGTDRAKEIFWQKFNLYLEGKKEDQHEA